MKNCEYYEAQIDLLLDGLLTPSEEAELRIHLAACPACEEKEYQLREIRAAVESLDDIEIPDGLHERIMAALPVAQPPKSRLRARWIRGLAAVAACALLGLAILRLPRMGSTAGNLAACSDTAAPESVDAGTNGGEAEYNAAADAGAYATGASDGCGEPTARDESGDDSITAEELPQDSMIAPSLAEAQLTQKAGAGTDGTSLPACSAAYAYAGDMAGLRQELEGFGAALTEDEADRVLLLFETGTETERSFLDRLAALDFQSVELPESGGYTLDQSAPYTLYILTQK